MGYELLFKIQLFEMNSYLSSISHEKKVIISYWDLLKIKKIHLKNKNIWCIPNTGKPFIRALMVSNDLYHPVS